MRLENVEVAGIIHGIEPFITSIPAELRLYGSRVDDNKKGGDIDLMLIVPGEVKSEMKEVKHKILVAIKKIIGERKIDLLICSPDSVEADPFVSLVYPSSISLKEWK